MIKNIQVTPITIKDKVVVDKPQLSGNIKPRITAANRATAPVLITDAANDKIKNAQRYNFDFLA